MMKRKWTRTYVIHMRGSKVAMINVYCTVVVYFICSISHLCKFRRDFCGYCSQFMLKNTYALHSITPASHKATIVHSRIDRLNQQYSIPHWMVGSRLTENVSQCLYTIYILYIWYILYISIIYISVERTHTYVCSTKISIKSHNASSHIRHTLYAVPMINWCVYVTMKYESHTYIQAQYSRPSSFKVTFEWNI